MRHFLFVGDGRDVLGVWEASDALSAARLGLKLRLMYPGCRTYLEAAPDFETFRGSFSDFDFDDLEPDQSDAEADGALGLERTGT